METANALAHMGQLRPPQARGLIKKHPNIHFIASHSNPIFMDGSLQPWVNMFAGESLTSDWKGLMVAHPDRFILGFDNVWKKHWRKLYHRQAALWRKTLLELPTEVAHAVALDNAGRLWKLPPLH